MRVAQALIRQGRLDEAMTHYLEIFRIRPLDVGARMSLANALFDTGRLDEAIAQYSEALRINPNLEVAHNRLGLALKKQGKRKEAIAQFEEAVRVKPEFAEAHHNLALTFADHLPRLRVTIPLAHAGRVLAIDEAVFLHPADRHFDNLAFVFADDGFFSH